MAGNWCAPNLKGRVLVIGCERTSVPIQTTFDLTQKQAVVQSSVLPVSGHESKYSHARQSIGRAFEQHREISLPAILSEKAFFTLISLVINTPSLDRVLLSKAPPYPCPPGRNISAFGSHNITSQNLHQNAHLLHLLEFKRPLTTVT